MVRTKICSIIIGIGLLLFPLLSSAQLGPGEPIRLSADAVMNLALERSFSIKETETKRDVAYENVRAAKGIFDTDFAAMFSHEIDKSKRMSTVFGTRNDSTTWQLSFDQKLPSGTGLGLSLTNLREKTSGALAVGGVPIVPTQAQWEPILGIQFSQPLMQNAFGYIDRRTVEEARRAYASADANVRYQVSQIVAQSMLNYWGVVFTRAHVAALKKSVQFARNFLNTTLEEHKLGTAEKTDVLAGRANLASREVELEEAKDLAHKAEQSLRESLELDPGVDLVTLEQKPPMVDGGRVDDARLARSLAMRGDYQGAYEEAQRSRVKLAMEKNRRWPSLDLVSTLELNEIDPSYTDAFAGMDSPDWTIGMNFSVPLQNRVARAGARQAEAERARSVFALKNLENQVINEVSRLARSLTDRKRIVHTAKRSHILRIEKLHGELGKYNQGRSSADFIIRDQDDAVRAERTLIESWYDYERVFLELAVAEGILIPVPPSVEEQAIAAAAPERVEVSVSPKDGR